MADIHRSNAVERIEELARCCEALEASNAFFAAQLSEVNQAWRDAIAAIATHDEKTNRALAAALHAMAAEADGIRGQIFLEIANTMEPASQRG